MHFKTLLSLILILGITSALRLHTRARKSRDEDPVNIFPGITSQVRAGALIPPTKSDTSIYSPNGDYALTLEQTGDLVLYDRDHNVVWSSDTANSGALPFVLVMQADGNAVLYDHDGVTMWASGTDGESNVYLEVLDTGAFVVKNDDGKVFWASDNTKIGDLELND